MTQAALLKFLAPLPDEAILGLTLYGEARGEPIEGIIAVGCVIRNRVNDVKKRWPQTYRGVCLQKFQFSVWLEAGGAANHNEILALAQRLRDNEAIPELDEVAWVALGIARNALKDNTKRSNHYHSVSMKPRPTWAQSYVPATQVKGHVFYVL